jgi:hypothetical protein
VKYDVYFANSELGESPAAVKAARRKRSAAPIDGFMPETPAPRAKKARTTTTPRKTLAQIAEAARKRDEKKRIKEAEA